MVAIGPLLRSSCGAHAAWLQVYGAHSVAYMPYAAHADELTAGLARTSSHGMQVPHLSGMIGNLAGGVAYYNCET